MNPFKLKYNCTDPVSGIKWQQYQSLTAGSWAKITFWSIAPAAVMMLTAAAVESHNKKQSSFTEDTTVPKN